jgi:hypothetical protein
VPLDRDVDRARQAQAVLENPAFVDSYAALERAITDRWRNSRDAQDREELHRQLMALLLIRGHLETVLREGQIAADKLGREQTRADRMLKAVSR